MLVLQAEHVVARVVLVDAEDVQGGDVAVAGGGGPLLVHGEHVVAGAGNLRQHTSWDCMNLK